MATGFPTSYVMEIDWPGTGTFTAVTNDVDWKAGVLLQFGRTNEFEDVAPGSMVFTLFNEGGAYAGCRKLDPDSGLSQAIHSP